MTDLRAERPAKLTVFRSTEAVDLETSGAVDEVTFPDEAASLIAKFDMSLLAAGSIVDLVFRQDRHPGYSIVRAWFAPGYKLFRHRHDADCTYYITAGQLRLGNQTLRAGEGFFVPGNHPYTYEAGPAGLEVLEFRHSTTFNMRVLDRDEKRWTDIFAAASAHQELWKQLRADRLQSHLSQRPTE
jgi:quercetin dioxygenase-like cupin family protein